MSTTTAPRKSTPAAGLDRRPLPELRRDRTPAALAVLGDPFEGLVRERDERFAAAVSARSALKIAEQEIERAADRDREAFRQAALDGKPDPGRREEMAATVALEAAYTAALGCTDLANQAARDLFASIEGKGGDTAVAEIEQRITTARERLGEHLSVVEGDLAEIHGFAQLAEGIERARKRGDARQGWAARHRDPVIHARPASPGLIVDTLREFGAKVT